MALWIMGFGGTVPVGVLVGGWVGHAISITAVILAGAVWAVVLAAWSNCAVVAEPRGRPMSESHEVAYRGAAHARARAWSKASTRARSSASVPATPAWRAHDVLAHLVGVPDDVVNGRLDGLASDSWTQAQAVGTGWEWIVGARTRSSAPAICFVVESGECVSAPASSSRTSRRPASSSSAGCAGAGPRPRWRGEAGTAIPTRRCCWRRRSSRCPCARSASSGPREADRRPAG